MYFHPPGSFSKSEHDQISLSHLHQTSLPKITVWTELQSEPNYSLPKLQSPLPGPFSKREHDQITGRGGIEALSPCPDIAASRGITLPSRAFRYTVLATMFSNSISSSLTVYDHLGPALTLSHSSQDATQGGVLRGNMARTPRMPTLPMHLLAQPLPSSRPLWPSLHSGSTLPSSPTRD